MNDNTASLILTFIHLLSFPLGAAPVVGKVSEDIGFPSTDLDVAVEETLAGVLLPLTLFKKPFISI